MTDISRLDALKIAADWCETQQMLIDTHGGYIGELFMVRDRVVFFFNCNGEKYDGPRVSIHTIEEAINMWEWDEEFEDTPMPDDLLGYLEEIECCGQDAKSLADYIQGSDGSESASYSAGDPYKAGSVASVAFLKACNK